MYRIERIIVVTLLFGNILVGACPTAKFQFQNQTASALYNFLQSSVGNIGSLETCPYTGRPYVYLPCYANESWGHEPYFSNCVKPIAISTTMEMVIESSDSILSLDRIAKFPMKTSNDLTIIFDYLNRDRSIWNSSSNLMTMIDLLHRVTTSVDRIDNAVHWKFYSLVDRIFASPFVSQLKDVQQSNGSLVKFLSTLEIYVRTYLLNESDSLIVRDHLVISVHQRTKPIIGFTYDEMKIVPITKDDPDSNLTSIILSDQAIQYQNRLVFQVFNPNNSLFDEPQSRRMTPIFSLTLDRPEVLTRLPSWIIVHFVFDSHLNDDDEQHLYCASWVHFSNMTGRWTTHGCQMINRTTLRLTCQCDHSNYLAVLMDVKSNSTPRLLEQVFSIITWIGLTLSSVGLCLTILTFVLFEKLRRHFSQKSLFLLSLNLLLVNVFFLLIDFYRRDQLKETLCIILASFLHYFILSTFSWIFVLALIQYFLFVKVFPNSMPSFTKKAAAFAQLMPLIPVIVVLIIEPRNSTKRTDQICWLSNGLFYWSFVLPISASILINSILFSLVAHSLLCDKTNQQLRRIQMAEPHRLLRFFFALICFLVVSLSWMFGLFAIGSISLIFPILFCIFTSLSGLMIFVLYLLSSKGKRTGWNNTLKSLGMPSIYSPASSSSSGFLTTKEYSLSSNSASGAAADHQHQKIPSRRLQFPSQAQHFIDAYMPCSPPPPPPAPPIQPTLIIEGDDPLYSATLTNQFYESRHIWTSQINPPITSLDDYSLFYASHHDATKL